MKKVNLKHILLLTVVVVLLSLTLCACGGEKKPSGGGGGGGNNNNDKWEYATDQTEVYVKLISATQNALKDFSTEKMNAKSRPQTSFEVIAPLKINEYEYTINFKGKYDCGTDDLKTSTEYKTIDEKLRKKTIAAITLDDSNKKEVMAIYLYNNELYVQIGESKVKFDAAYMDWPEFFPLRLTLLDSQKIKGLANTFVSCINLIESVKTYTEKDIAYYKVNVDLPKTIVSLLSQANLFLDSTESLENIIKVLFGISQDQEISTSTLPQMSSSVEFSIAKDALNDINVGISVDLSHTQSFLVDGNQLNITASLDAINIYDTYNAPFTIDFIKDQDYKDFESYSQAIYVLDLKATPYNITTGQKENDEYCINVISRVFQDDAKDDFLFFEYENKTTNKVESALYVYDDIAYFYLTVDGNLECVYQLPIPLGEVASKVVSTENQFSSSEDKKNLDIISLIGYILKYTGFSNDGISFEINNSFFKDIWYNFDDVLVYANGLDPDTDILDPESLPYEFFYELSHRTIVALLAIDEPFMYTTTFDDSEITSIIEKLPIPDNSGEQGQEPEND